ncbi:MAG TPA: quinone-dependent dihydroorotate dehydrogenase [Jiangellaceae bacterium]
MKTYEWVFNSLLRRLDAERAHRWSFRALRTLVATPGGNRLVHRVCHVPDLPVEAMGLRFANPLGLAAGFDKNGVGIDAIAALGFGFVEIGTVTGQPQPGNPRPRLFRLPRDRAVVNRMGFNNDGAPAVAARLARRERRLAQRVKRGRGKTRHRPVVGVNIGKTKLVPAEQAIDDYVTSARRLAPYADYLVVNVSSPNTPGLRDLQAIDQLRPLLAAVRATVDDAAQRPVPLLVKIAPDLADDDVRGIAELATELGLAGIIATNTTTDRAGLASDPHEVEQIGAGGLSGAPLKERSLEVLRLLRAHAGSSLTIVSAGGIESAEDIIERIQAGATLVQAYTGLVYGGPLWPSRTLRRLAAERDGGRR